MRKILALVITLVIFSTLSVPCSAVGDTAESHWIPVSFSSSISTDTQNKMMIKWDWNDLLTNAAASGENSDLAIAGLVMSNQAEFSKEYVEEVLNTIGFADISSEYYSANTKDKSYISNPARTFAHREIDVNGEKKHIICAVIRGTRSVFDAITDIKSVKDGFLDSGKDCLESLKEYQRSLKGVTKDNTILFITGHSLGASAACVLSCLADEVAYKSATHTYAFATPNYDTMELESKDYQNIHMYTNLDDMVPKVPINFKKVGVEKSYSYDTLSFEERAGFDRVYKYFRGKTYSEDGDINSTDLIGRLRDHMGFTYMSFILSEKSDSEIDNYIASYESPIDGDINQSMPGDVNADGDIKETLNKSC